MLIKNLKVLLFSVLILVQIVRSLYTELPKLITKQQKLLYPTVINATASDTISFSLPRIDSSYSTLSMSFYSSDEKVPQQLQEFDSQKLKVTQLNNDNNPFSCQLISGEVKIDKTYTTINTNGVGSQQFFQVYEKKLHAFVKSKQLFYVLNEHTMHLQVYRYNDKELLLQSSLTLKRSEGHKAMIVTTDEKYLLITTSNIIYQIQTKTFLAKITELNSLGKYQLEQHNHGINKLIAISQGLLIGLHSMQKVTIIKYSTKIEQQNKTKQITMFKNEKILPKDIAFNSEKNYLYILDHSKGIYLFRLLPSLDVYPLTLIQFETMQNSAITVFGLQIFCKFTDQDGSKVVQIQYNEEKNRGQLIRYYKNNDFISYSNVFSVPQPSNSSYMQKANELFMYPIKQQTYLFLLADDDYLEIYPFGLDSRIIGSLNGGVKLQMNEVQNVYHVYGNNFIFMMRSQLLYVRMHIKKPQIKCSINPQIPSVYDYFLIEIANNVSYCYSYQKQTKSVNQICTVKEQYIFMYKDPHFSLIERIIIYVVVAIVVLLFILGLLCLIKWRNKKITILLRLKSQIKKFRDRAKRMQPFIEQQTKSKQINVELPVILNEDVQTLSHMQAQKIKLTQQKDSIERDDKDVNMDQNQQYQLRMSQDKDEKQIRRSTENYKSLENQKKQQKYQDNVQGNQFDIDDQ